MLTEWLLQGNPSTHTHKVKYTIQQATNTTNITPLWGKTRPRHPSNMLAWPSTLSFLLPTLSTLQPTRRTVQKRLHSYRGVCKVASWLPRVLVRPKAFPAHKVLQAPAPALPTGQHSVHLELHCWALVL